MALLVAGRAVAQELSPRKPLAREPVVARALPPGTVTIGGVPPYRLIVKFRDEVQARASHGLLVSIAGADLSGTAAVISTFDLGFSPLIRLPEATLIELEQRAAARSGVGQPDLAGLLEVHVPAAGPAELEAAGDALQRLPEVEFAYIQTLGVPPPGDIPPTTPNLVALQSYRGPNPGMDANYAAALGFTGSSVRLSDCEYAWNYGHEDLVDKDLHPEPGQTIHPGFLEGVYDEHGTAVLGQTSGVENAYGVTGMVPDAEVYTYPEFTVEENQRRVTAIAHAIADSSAGDVVLLEMQTMGPGGGLGPAELDLAVWLVVRTGADAGVVVVAAAGNGAQDLDSKPYGEYMDRGDSGAIIVGAGTSDTNHDRHTDSTFGSRVDVQGWGESVFTLGFGDFGAYGGPSDENQYYTATFGGTSGASPFVAAAAVALEQAADKALSPEALRELLRRNGIPQGSGGHIGPFVNLRAALEELLGPNGPPEIRVTLAPSGTPVPSGFLYDFGDLFTNDLPVSQLFDVCNDGAGDLVIDNPTSLVSGIGFAQVGIPASTVSPGVCTSFQVRFNPGPGAYTGAVTIDNNDADEDPYHISLKGEVTQSPLIRVTLAPSGSLVPNGWQYDFGSWFVNHLPTAQLFNLCNDGTGNLVIDNPTSLVSGTGFAQIGAVPATPLAPGVCTTFQVRFNAAPGSYIGAVTIQNNFPTEDPYTFTLRGTAVASSPEIRVEPSGTYHFGILSVGSLPVFKLFSICNDGTEDLGIDNPATLVSGTGFTQVGTPATLVAPGVCTSFQVRFQAGPGAYTGAVSIQNNDPNEDPLNVTLKAEVTN